MRSQWALTSSVLLAATLFQVSASSIYEQFEECRKESSFGNTTFVCDHEHILQKKVINQLEALLRGLQEKVECDCENGCARGEGLPSAYIALMFVTNSSGLNETEKASLNGTLKKIYEKGRLGDENCDNGLVIVYIKDQKNLATYRGKDRFMLLDEDEMAKLHRLSVKTEAQEQKNPADTPKVVQLAFPDNWIPFIGLIVVLLLIFVIFCMLVCIAARLCCRRPKKYYINPSSIANYKSVEPIYLPTPVPSLRGGGSHTVQPVDHQYGPPFSTLPFPEHYPTPPHIYLSPRSRSMTPTSVHRVRRDGTGSATATPAHPASTPVSSKKRIEDRQEAEPERIEPLSDREEFLQQHVRRGAPGLPFLDPRRKLEVQTREEFID